MWLAPNMTLSKCVSQMSLCNKYIKVQVSFLFSNLLIAAHPAKSLILCDRSSLCQQCLFIVKSHSNLAVKVKTWMGLKGLQETWVQPPHPPVLPSLSGKMLFLPRHSVFYSVCHFPPYLAYIIHDQSNVSRSRVIYSDCDPHTILFV